MTIVTDVPQPTTPGDNPAWEPRGHPVRWAVGAVALVGGLSLASIWFGALSPRVDAEPTAWGSELGSPDEAYVVIDLTNDAHATVRLVAAGESLPGLELTATEVGDHAAVVGDGATALDDPVTIESGATVAVALRYRVTGCERVPSHPPAIPLVLRTAAGLTRTVDGPDVLSGANVDGITVSWTEDLLPRC